MSVVLFVDSDKTVERKDTPEVLFDKPAFHSCFVVCKHAVVEGSCLLLLGCSVLELFHNFPDTYRKYSIVEDSGSLDIYDIAADKSGTSVV